MTERRNKSAENVKNEIVDIQHSYIHLAMLFFDALILLFRRSVSALWISSLGAIWKIGNWK